MRKALEKEAIAERSGEERISRRRDSDGAREANKLCLTRGTTS